MSLFNDFWEIPEEPVFVKRFVFPGQQDNRISWPNFVKSRPSHSHPLQAVNGVWQRSPFSAVAAFQEDWQNLVSARDPATSNCFEARKS